jgi:tetratricopeptide (TPR) repeat protein
VAHYELALIYTHPQYQDAKSALKHIEAAIAMNPENNWYQVLYADILTDLGQFRQAADIYGKLVEEEPDNYDHYFQHAYLLIQADAFSEAINVYDQLESIVGIDEQVIEQKKRLYLRLNDIESAAAEQEKLIEAYPQDGRYYSRLADLYKANGMDEKADEVYERLLKVDPNNPYALLAVAFKNFDKGDKEAYKQNLLRALRNRELGIDLKIRALYPYLEYNELYKEDIDMALELADAIVETHPDEAKSYAIKGDLLYLEERLQEAVEAYNLALEQDPGVFNVWRQLLFIYSDLNDYESLRDKSAKAKEYFPNQPFIYYFEGVSEQQLKNYDPAIKAYNRALMMSDQNPNLQAQIWANLGDVYHELKEHLASDTSYENSLALDDSNPYVLNNYSYYLSLRGDKLDQAREMSLRANELVPDNTAFIDTYAWILYKLGDYQEAKTWQQKALDNGGDERPVLLEHYGDILFKLGEKEAAVEYWNQALEKGGDEEKLLKKINDQQLYED